MNRMGPPRRFVLLEHRWNGAHWDLMLDTGLALATWAIDAPIVAGRDLPARALPDHRRVYLEYEGDVSGGRGTVRRVDQGTYEVRLWTPRLVRIRLSGTQLVGAVELRGPGDGTDGELETPLAWTFRLGNFD